LNGRAFTGAWIETHQSVIGQNHCISRAFTGAWIETAIAANPWIYMRCRAFTGAWIETATRTERPLVVFVAPSRARGLKPRYWLRSYRCRKSRLHGRVD